MSLIAKIAAFLLILTGLVAGVWKLYHDIDKSGYDRGYGVAKGACEAQAKKDKAAADKQHDDNRQALDAAAKSASDASIKFETTIRGTQNELRKATANLAVCHLEHDAVRLLNDAASAAKD
jgi:hypothetical protein